MPLIGQTFDTSLTGLSAIRDATVTMTARETTAAVKANPAVGTLLTAMSAVDDPTLTGADAPSVTDLVSAAREVSALSPAVKAELTTAHPALADIIAAADTIPEFDTVALDEHVAALADAKRTALSEAGISLTMPIGTIFDRPPPIVFHPPPVVPLPPPPPVAPPAPPPSPPPGTGTQTPTPQWWTSLPAWWNVAPAPLLQNRVLPTTALAGKVAAALPNVSDGDVIKAEHVKAIRDAFQVIVEFLHQEVGEGSAHAPRPVAPPVVGPLPPRIDPGIGPRFTTSPVLDALATRGLTVSSLAGGSLRSVLDQLSTK